MKHTRIMQRINGLFRAKLCGLVNNITIEKNVLIGPNKYFVLNEGCLSIHEGVRIRDCFRCVLDGGSIVISQGTFLNSGVSLNSRIEITIGKYCHIGPNVSFFDHDHKFGKNVNINSSGFSNKAIKVGENVWIGANVTVLKGVKIGSNCVVAAGITVRDSIPDGHILLESGLVPLR